MSKKCSIKHSLNFEIIYWWTDFKRNKLFIVSLWLIFMPYLGIWSQNFYSYWVKCGMSAKSARISSRDVFLCSVFLCSLKHLNQISVSFFFFLFLLYLFVLDFIPHLQWDYFIIIIIKLTATEKSASFYLTLLDLSLGFPLLLTLEQRKEIQHEKSQFSLMAYPDLWN